MREEIGEEQFKTAENGGIGAYERTEMADLLKYGRKVRKDESGEEDTRPSAREGRSARQANMSLIEENVHFTDHDRLRSLTGQGTYCGLHRLPR